MAIPIKPLRRTGSAGQPNIDLMQEGEIAVNSYERKIWMRVGGNLVEIGNAVVPSLQQVTDAGNTTGKSVVVQTATGVEGFRVESPDASFSVDYGLFQISFNQPNLSSAFSGNSLASYKPDQTSGVGLSMPVNDILNGSEVHSILLPYASGSLVLDAPQDGKTYGRKDAGWEEVTGGGSDIDVENPKFGSTTDSTSDTKILTVSSNGFAGIFVNGDASNTSGEPGGSFIVLGIDGGEYDSGATKPFFSAINSTGSDGKGGAWAGTTSNSGLIGIPGNYRLQFGTNGQIAFYVQGADATFNGAVTDQSGDVRRVKHRLSNANTTISDSDMNGIIEKSNNTAYTYSMPSGMGTVGDILTLVNSGTAQAGTITVNGASGVVFRTGTTSVSSFTIGPSEIANLYRSNTNNRWIKA